MEMFQIIGAAGLLLISVGIITKQRKIQDLYYIIGGLSLLAYSSYLGNVIFITLQIIFTLAAVYDLIKVKHKKMI